MKTVFIGDVFPGGDLLQMPETFNPLVSLNLPEDSCLIANIESPLTDAETTENKCVLFSPKKSVAYLGNMNLSYAALANNHFHDKCSPGMADTVECLRSAGIQCCGGGENYSAASGGILLKNGLYLFSFCRYGHLTLNQIAVATETAPGIAELTLENVKAALDTLPEGKKAILYFHWGCEHLWMTAHSNIKLAKDLLEDPRVALIIGTHPHRIQGRLKHRGKCAYFSLGNALFPNFYIAPPCTLTYQFTAGKNVPYTREYHPVDEITHKKWRLVNRISLLVEFDSETGTVSHKYIYQKDNSPEIVFLENRAVIFFLSCAFGLLSALVYLPSIVYKVLFLIHYKSVFLWRKILIHATILKWKLKRKFFNR